MPNFYILINKIIVVGETNGDGVGEEVAEINGHWKQKT
jgi:hypothetical protein